MRGFTLIEVMVAVSVFVIVVVIGIGALISVNAAYSKARSQNLVLDNLNFAIESMARAIRVGEYYECFSGALYDTSPSGRTTKDCEDGDDGIAFNSPQEGNDGTIGGYERVAYRFQNGRIERRVGKKSFTPITGGDVEILGLQFYVFGTKIIGDATQPIVIIRATARAGSGTTDDVLVIETAVTQRALDIPATSSVQIIDPESN
jgi:prepilin-type N-terminal cleavage/methylation domain-containing protein